MGIVGRVKMGLVEGKVAIITGAGANIGEACAKMLAKNGASVVVADINMDGAERVAGEINASGSTAMARERSSAAKSVVARSAQKRVGAVMTASYRRP